jgi:hypothetical protein
MTAQPKKIEAGNPLENLRRAFDDHHISKLPKETRAQIDARKAPDGRKVMVFGCAVCGGHHHKDATHLDYVGHAALTDRLLDTDINWSWEPVGFTPEGLPALDRNGGLWIKLTVCGVTRYGYGAADGKSGGDAMKEMIGDALRNAAMRFGAALDLWHKGDLHPEEEIDEETGEILPRGNGPVPRTKLDGKFTSKTALKNAVMAITNGVRKAGDGDEISDILKRNKDTIEQAERDWPELITGDPKIEGDGGLKGYVKKRREELAGSVQFQFLASLLAECQTQSEVQNIAAKHGEAIDALEDVERRRFEARFDEREAALAQLDKVTGGA